MGVGLVIFVSVISLVILLKTRPSLPPPQKESLTLEQVFPPEGKNETLFTATAIQFTFDSPIVVSTAGVLVEPQIDFVVETSKANSQILIVRPKDAWELNVPYTVTIKKGLQSINNKELKEDVVYSVEFVGVEDVTHF